jgi:hypothetical protein
MENARLNRKIPARERVNFFGNHRKAARINRG